MSIVPRLLLVLLFLASFLLASGVDAAPSDLPTGACCSTTRASPRPCLASGFAPDGDHVVVDPDPAPDLVVFDPVP